MNSIVKVDSCQLVKWACQIDNGCVIRGQRTPPSGKPVIHFLHGNGFCGLSYWPFLSRLAGDYDIFIQDIQGHGDSDAGDRFWGWNENARVVRQVWQHFQPDYSNVTALGMGHSFGSILTALVAADHPTAFRGLVLLDPVIFTPTMLVAMKLFKLLRLKSPNPLVKKALRRRNQWSSLSDVKQDFEGKGMFKHWHDDALMSHIHHALYESSANNFRLKCSPAREAEIFATFPRHLWSSLRKISTPTSLFYGTETDSFVKKSVNILQRWDSSLIKFNSVPGGHCFMQEDPAMSAQKVGRLIAWPGF